MPQINEYSWISLSVVLIFSVTNTMVNVTYEPMFYVGSSNSSMIMQELKSLI